LLDLDKTDIVSSLLTHLKTEPENIIQLIENRTTPKEGKEYIECLDVRNLKLEDIFKIFQQLNVTEQVNLQYWDTSKFTSMKNMFSFKTKSQSISTMFDIKETKTTNETTNKTLNINVTGLKYWNTSRVTDMNSMFRNNVTFNEELNWDTSQVIDMSNMFNNATSFNRPVSSWDTSHVVDMSSMFKNATSFNQDVSNWDTSHVVDMSSMFNNATRFNQHVSSWDTRKVFDMRNMFNNATNFNQTIPWETKVIFDDDIITGSGLNAKLSFEYKLE
jgi:surface protein